ncbi:MICOS complex subunit MIC10-like [Typha angustifolia]|uniref:MICOS complex subunit MIC10-like n=1 Tax=Typha angustifolia TaxID=59011 RepID=UPI003C3025D4
MAEEEKKKLAVPPRYDLDAKWNACLDIAIRRLVYSSVAGGFSGLLFFRSPTTRWASVAFGAGVGIGAAYTECSYLFDGSPPKWSPNVSASPASSQEKEN